LDRFNSFNQHYHPIGSRQRVFELGESCLDSKNISFSKNC